MFFFFRVFCFVLFFSRKCFRTQNSLLNNSKETTLRKHMAYCIWKRWNCFNFFAWLADGSKHLWASIDVAMGRNVVKGRKQQLLHTVANSKCPIVIPRNNTLLYGCRTHQIYNFSTNASLNLACNTNCSLVTLCVIIVGTFFYLYETARAERCQERRERCFKGLMWQLMISVDSYLFILSSVAVIHQVLLWTTFLHAEKSWPDLYFLLSNSRYTRRISEHKLSWW